MDPLDMVGDRRKKSITYSLTFSFQKYICTQYIIESYIKLAAAEENTKDLMKVILILDDVFF